MKIKIFFRRFLIGLKKKNSILFLTAIIGLIVGVVCNYRVLDDRYESTSSIYVSPRTMYTENGKVVDNQLYTDIILSKKVAEAAAVILTEYEVDSLEIRQNISCTNSKDSQVYKIIVYTDNPSLSILLANAVAKSAVAEINYLLEENRAQVLDEAGEYIQVLNGKQIQIRNICFSMILGILGGMIIILLMVSFSTKIDTVTDVTLNGEIEILGVIPNFDVE